VFCLLLESATMPEKVPSDACCASSQCCALGVWATDVYCCESASTNICYCYGDCIIVSSQALSLYSTGLMNITRKYCMVMCMLHGLVLLSIRAWFYCMARVEMHACWCLCLFLSFALSADFAVLRPVRSVRETCVSVLGSWTTNEGADPHQSLFVMCLRGVLLNRKRLATKLALSIVTSP